MEIGQKKGEMRRDDEELRCLKDGVAPPSAYQDDQFMSPGHLAYSKRTPTRGEGLSQTLSLVYQGRSRTAAVPACDKAQKDTAHNLKARDDLKEVN